MQFGPRTFLFFILLLVMPMAAWWFLFKPYDAHLDEVRRETSEKRQTLQDLSIKVARSKDMHAEIAKLQDVLVLFDNKLPPAKETEKVYNEVWNLAVKNKMDIKSVHTMPVEEQAGYSQQSIQMKMTGPMQPGFYTFLSDVERKLKRLSRISEMKITADDVVPGMVTAEIVLTVYFENNGKTVTQ